MKKESLSVILFLLIFISILFFMTLGYKPRTRLVPLIVIIPTLILGLVVLAGEIFPRIRKMFEVDLFHMGGALEEDEFEPKWSEGKGFLIIFSWFLLLSLLIFLVGFLIAVPICVFLFIKYCGKRTWSKSLILPAVIGIFLYCFFNVFMRIELFNGMILRHFE